MENASNMKYVRNLTRAQQKEVIKELAMVFQRVRTKPVLKVCKPAKKG